MFVKNLTKEVIDFRKNGRVLKLKPGVNQVDDFKWSKDDLMKTYGPTILAIFNEEKVEETEAEENAPKENADEVNTPVADENIPTPTEGKEAPTEAPVVEGENEGEGKADVVVEGDKAEETADKDTDKKPATKKATKKANK